MLIAEQEKLERVMGIEPTSSAWEADALPLCYIRLLKERVTGTRLQEEVNDVSSFVVIIAS